MFYYLSIYFVNLTKRRSVNKMNWTELNRCHSPLKTKFIFVNCMVFGMIHYNFVEPELYVTQMKFDVSNRSGKRLSVHRLNNKVSLLWDYRLIVSRRKFDVLKANISPKRDTSRAYQYASCKDNKAASFRPIDPRQQHCYFYWSPLIFLRIESHFGWHFNFTAHQFYL